MVMLRNDRARAARERAVGPGTLAFLVVAITGCADMASDLDEPQDAVDGTGKADGAACAISRCGDPEALHVLFPGNPACGGPCERQLAGADLYIPPTNGKPWGDTYLLGASADTLAGYSSGRIALLRRLALVGDGQHAVMLDPSWPDGERDFVGRGPERGDAIVHDWLAADSSRTFLLVYSTRSIGWQDYAALAATDVGAQVKVCSVGVPHLSIPAIPHIRDALVAPVDWDNGTCH
jgi:hypothetical protein